jgi:hypothetical protein
MILDRKVEAARRPPALDSTLSASDRPTGTLSCGRFGSSARKASSSLSNSPRRTSLASSSSFSAATWAIDCRSIFTAAFEHTDLLREAVATRLQLLCARLQALAFIFERLESRSVERKTTRGQPLGKRLDVVAQQLDVEHAQSSRWRSPATRESALLPLVARSGKQLREGGR